MKINNFDCTKEVLIVAEIGNNHEGSFDNACRLVEAAAKAEVHAVKFQTYKTELFVNPKDQARWNRMKNFELKQEEFEELSKLAHQLGLLFISTPLDLESARFLNKTVSAFKIASGDNNWLALLEYVASTGKPLIISTGLSNLKDLKQTTAIIENVWKGSGVSGALALLHCVTSYPVPYAQANLLAIRDLQRSFSYPIGYSDHTLGIEASVLAVALGARIIEKHFTLDKGFSDFRDHKLSANPQEMAELVRQVKQAQEMLGNGVKNIQPCEQTFVRDARRSIVASRNLNEGKCIEASDITWMRPADGLPPGKEAQVLGQVLRKPIKKGEVLLPPNREKEI